MHAVLILPVCIEKEALVEVKELNKPGQRVVIRVRVKTRAEIICNSMVSALYCEARLLFKNITIISYYK